AWEKLQRCRGQKQPTEKRQEPQTDQGDGRMRMPPPAAPFAAVGTAVHDREWWAVEAVHACTDWCGSVAAALEMMFAAGIIEEPAAQAMTPWDAPSWRDAALEDHRDRPGRGRSRMARAPRPSSILQSKFSKRNFTMTDEISTFAEACAKADAANADNSSSAQQSANDWIAGFAKKSQEERDKRAAEKQIAPPPDE